MEVDYTPHQAQGDTATRDDDFSWLSGVLLLAPGVMSGTVQVITTDDALDEGNETFTVTLTGATNAVLPGLLRTVPSIGELERRRVGRNSVLGETTLGSPGCSALCAAAVALEGQYTSLR